MRTKVVKAIRKAPRPFFYRDPNPELDLIEIQELDDDEVDPLEVAGRIDHILNFEAETETEIRFYESLLRNSGYEPVYYD